MLVDVEIHTGTYLSEPLCASIDAKVRAKLPIKKKTT
jgi:hypothetical protein